MVADSLKKEAYLHLHTIPSMWRLTVLEGEQKLSGLNIFFEGAIGLFHSKMVIYDLEYLRL